MIKTNQLPQNPGRFNMASAACIILFPGYVIYHYGMISSYWFSTTPLFGYAVVFFSFFGLHYLSGRTITGFRNASLLEKLFFMYLLYLMAWSICASVYISDTNHSLLALKDSIYTLILWLAVYYIGVTYRLTSKINHLFMIMSSLLIVTMFAIEVVQNQAIAAIYQLFNTETEYISSYQGIGRAISVIALFIAAFSRNYYTQIYIFIFAGLILLGVGSRAHLFAMIFIITIMFLFDLVRLKRLFHWVTIAILGFVFIDNIIEFFLATRSGEVLNLIDSSSWIARNELNDIAISKIIDSPFFGSYAYWMADSSGYAHNILSAWTQYGVVGFCIFFGLLFYGAGITISRILFRKPNQVKLWMLAFQLNVFAIFLAFASEPIDASVFPALAWGFTVQALHSEAKSFEDRANDGAVRPPFV